MGLFDFIGDVAAGPSGLGGGKYIKKHLGDKSPDFFSSDAYATMNKLRPEFTSLVDPSTGKLSTQYQVETAPSNMPTLEEMLAGINLNTQGLEKFRGEALRDAGTDSLWAQIAKQQQAMEEQGVIDKAARAGATSTASAFSNLARRGGTSAGARERLAGQGALGLMRGRQDIAMEGAKARANIASTDESNRIGMLGQLPGMEVAALQPGLQKTNIWAQMAGQESAQKYDANKFNVGNLIGERDKKAEYDMGKYAEIMKAWGADRTAAAQENSGKK
ncbi:MAG: hypothetical protein HC841_00260 [Verrucomicrobiae bacterium]|nr:hypothetical protein [Verrucomicrobiae bacterium]